MREKSVRSAVSNTFPCRYMLAILSGTSLFLPFAAAQSSHLSYATPASWCAGPGSPAGCQVEPNAVAVADVTGATMGGVPDGWPDVAVCAGNGVRLFRNTQNWTNPADGLATSAAMFYEMEAFAAAPYDCEFADMDKDGDLDLVVTANKIGEFPLPYVIILYNQNQSGQPHEGWGVGDFTGPQDATPLLEVHQFTRILGLTTGDFDGDGYVDVAVSGSGSASPSAQFPRIKMLIRNQALGWSTIQSFAIEQLGLGWEGYGAGTDVAKALVCDNTPIAGRYDLILSTENYDGFGTSSFFTFRNLGPMGTPVWHPLRFGSANSQSVAVGKFRPNEPNDAVVVGHPVDVQAPDVVRLHYKNSCELYETVDPTLAPLGNGLEPFSFDVGAILGTDDNDVAIACRSGAPGSGFENGCVVVRLGNGSGDFLSPAHAFVTDTGPAEIRPRFVQIANMNQDALNDLVVTNHKRGTVAVLINTTLGSIPPSP